MLTAEQTAGEEFSITGLRPYQLEALESLIALRKNTIVRVPTGLGKSLIFRVSFIEQTKELEGV